MNANPFRPNKKERYALRRALENPQHRAFGNWTMLWRLAEQGLLLAPTQSGLVWTLTEAGIALARSLPPTPETTESSKTQSDPQSDTFKNVKING